MKYMTQSSIPKNFESIQKGGDKKRSITKTKKSGF